MKQKVACLCLSLAFACAQNVTVQVGGKTVGTRGVINFQPGDGSIPSCMDDPANHRVTCSTTADAAYFVTQSSLHNNPNYCISPAKSTRYACVLPGPPMSSFAPGMVFVFVPGATCTAACSLDISGLGPRVVKQADGITDPAGALVAGQPYWLFYDGNVFRLMTAAPSGGGPVTEANRDRDVIARRFIASMETMAYAPSISLEVAAGDLHKTITSNAVGNATINAVTGGLPGQHMWIIILNDQISGKTITFGSNLRSSGPLTGTAGKAATIQFVPDGTAWYEISRTTNL